MSLSTIEIKIGELRELHTTACTQGDWERAQRIRGRIITLWDSFHHAVELDHRRAAVDMMVQVAHGRETSEQ